MIGIIGAMDEEVDEIKKLIANKKNEKIGNLTYISGNIFDKECVVVKCGIGKVNAAMCVQSMILRYEPDLVMCTGIAGTLSAQVKSQDIVLASNVVQHDVDQTAFGMEEGFIQELGLIEIPCDQASIKKLISIVEKQEQTFHSGTIATGDQFIANSKRSKEISRKFSAIACDMESGSIGQVCYSNAVPFVIVKTISDDASDTAVSDYIKFKKIVAQRSADIITGFLEG